MTELENIEYHSGMKVNECSCDKCVSMCKTAPCLGTPADIWNLIEAGFSKFIYKTGWVAGMKYGMPRIQMYQIAFDLEKKQCPMLNNNLCKLHARGLKPTEGKLADCNVYELQPGKYPPAWIVALSWNFPENREIVEKIRNYMDERITKQVTEWLMS